MKNIGKRTLLALISVSHLLGKEARQVADLQLFYCAKGNISERTESRISNLLTKKPQFTTILIELNGKQSIKVICYKNVCKEKRVLIGGMNMM